VGLIAGGVVESRQGEPRWFSAWTTAHNIGEIVPALDNTTVRMMVRPTIPGRALRIKLANTRAQTPATFSAAFVGVPSTGAAIVEGTNTRVTFGGSTEVTLAPGEGAWSDAVTFDAKAFQRLAVSLNVTSASDVSIHALGLVTNYSAAGSHAADSSRIGFTPIAKTVPGSSVVEFPFYWLSAVDVQSATLPGPS